MAAPEPGAPGEITRLLVDWKRGDRGAANRLFPLVYDELVVLAHRQLGRGGREHSLETTSLVHEAYVKLVDQNQADMNDRNHFFSVACKTMRHILVDHARARTAQKRGGGGVPAVLDENPADPRTWAAGTRAVEVIAVDTALTKLEALDRRLAEIVEMRFFGGLSVEETAEALEVSPRTVKRDWQKARAFLLLELDAGPR